MENQICPLHKTLFFGKEWNGMMLYSHIIKDVGFCDGKKIKPFKEGNGSVPVPKPPVAEGASSNGDQKVWDAKDRQSMAQTAMKSASEITAALINAGLASFSVEDVKQMANEFYKELKKLKAEV